VARRDAGISRAGLSAAQPPAPSGPVRARPISAASSDDDIARQIGRLMRLIASGELDRRARRGSYINILV